MKISVCFDGECVQIAELNVSPTLATVKTFHVIRSGEVYKVVVTLYIEQQG